MNISSKQLIGSMAWKSIEKLIVQLTRLVIEIVMARLLVPEDFGVFTLLLTCIALANIVIEGGLGNALIQRKEIDEKDIDTTFWIMMALAFVFFLIFFFGTKMICDFYNNSSMEIYLKVIAIVMFPAAFNSIQISIATREMRFKDIFKANSVAIIISGAIGVALAVFHFGIWALIIQYCIQILTSCLILGIKTKWIPHFSFSIAHGKDLYSFGWKIMCSNLLNRGYGEIYNLVIGKIFNTTTLGYYNRGKLIPGAIENGLTSVVITVLFPYFSRKQEEINSLRLEMQKCIQLMLFIVAPVFMGLAAVADPLVRILLTDKWIEIVPIFQVLCFGFLFQPISHINITVINSMGKSDIVLKLEIIKRAIGLIILIITAQFSIFTVAIGLSISYLINMFINVRQNNKLIHYSMVDLLKSISPSIFASLLMFVTISMLSNFYSFNAYISLCIDILIGVLTYCLFSFLFNRKVFIKCFELARKIMRKQD